MADRTLHAFNRILLTALFAVALVGTSQGQVKVAVSGTVDPGTQRNQPIIDFLIQEFGADVTYGNYANPADIPLGTELVVIGRAVSSGDYTGHKTAWDNLDIPVVCLTSYVAQNNRLQWHNGGVNTNMSFAGDETTVTAAGASVFGGAGQVDWWTANLRGWGVGTGANIVGEGRILARHTSNAERILVAQWNKGETSAGGAAFGSDRLLFNINQPGDNDPVQLPTTAAGRKALIDALKAFTPLEGGKLEPLPPGRSPVKVNGTILEINDCSGRRFFAAGMVDNIPNSGLQLSLYCHDEMRNQFVYHKEMGATGMRWNAFLRGRDLRWDEDGYVTGMCDNAVANLKDGCDLAHEYGIVVQIVLSTAHFLQYGHPGATAENVTRVNNNKLMFETLEGTQAYIDNVIIPICQGIGTHPGLFGYCIINEANGMYYPDDAPTGTWSDVKVRLSDFQKFVNRVASAIKTHQPGAILSVSGVASGIAQFNDAALINAAGHTNGLMDIHQIQFYPNNHGEAWSPFLHTPAQLAATYGGDLKPMICGEFPIEGIIDDGSGKFKGSEEFGLEEAYTRLWNNGHSGGFTWSNRVYENADPAKQAVIETAYTNFYNNYLFGMDLAHPLDWTFDGIIDVAELVILANAWLSTDPDEPGITTDPKYIEEPYYRNPAQFANWDGRCGLNGDYRVDLIDFAYFVEHWGCLGWAAKRDAGR